MNRSVSFKWQYAEENIFTYCTVIFNGVTLRGKAERAEEDKHVKEIARRVSLRRAIVSLPKDDRAYIWECYFERMPNVKYALSK